MNPPSEGSGRAARRVRLLAAFAVVAAAGAAFLPRIPQDPAYHAFADARTLLRVPRACDVLSNAPFLVAGIFGLLASRRGGRGRFRDDAERLPWRIVFVGVAAVGVGSAYYHLEPTTPRLAWDRLPMAIVFGALVAAQWAERVDAAAGRRLAAPLAAFGAASVGWWAFTEAEGRGDLRWYGYVQFFPPLFVGALWAAFPATYDRSRDYVVAGLWYAAAKVTEFADVAIFEATGFVSGHTLKHLFAAAAVGTLAAHVVRRRPRDGAPASLSKAAEPRPN